MHRTAHRDDPHSNGQRARSGVEVLPPAFELKTTYDGHIDPPAVIHWPKFINQMLTDIEQEIPKTTNASWRQRRRRSGPGEGPADRPPDQTLGFSALLIVYASRYNPPH